MRKLAIGIAVLGTLNAPAFLQGQVLKVRVQDQTEWNRVGLQSLADETLVVTADSFPVEIMRLKALEQVTVTAEGNEVKLSRDQTVIGRFQSVEFWCNDSKPRFALHFERKKDPVVHYPGGLKVSASAGQLKLINLAPLEDYITGVVHAEAGMYKSLEFFKVQAVSARTYALMHLGRHASEGFDLCDQTHCQAFKGLPANNPLVNEAVKLTAREVIVFQDSVLIEAVFSANCGGYTANSEDVWVKPIEYLRAVPDGNFCEGFVNHNWHLTLSRAEFMNKLGKYHKTEVVSFEIVPDVSGRVKRIVLNDDPRYTITGEELRRVFSFRSSHFHVLEGPALVFIEGEGFGHGVGMCQDGAYHLAEMGLDYQKIVKHYYQNVSLKPLDEVKVKW